ncbi:hypothetical protein EV294_101352 [Paenibacillus sp. BK033]|uniref:hypothetical protein n=1 Tax=Paenibacillus sp. BK033 TaxID=2512133 RepID=UPI001044C5EE|nr:hypothetical protein [Paenibacillus sp. BK033]TCN00902.1 hypothetical protein EV294_101352 [Paenibacillus sp. BK033]
MDEMKKNPVLSAILERFIGQQAKGLEKYGELVNLDSYSLIEWIEHAQQEITDQLIYLECIKQKLIGSGQ